MYVCTIYFYELSALVGRWFSVSIRKIMSNVLGNTAFVVSGKVGYPLTDLTTPVGWH